ncbi:hypothetical protein BGZ80_000075 [Entomortierella chlamydospora]|uniref:Zn(2)-C6 fungal-type domain-containing protein n=1 Tax=Entomortierella chlamydospora TaxID=101097 RepID=A0A9P6MTF3_9FUNG|nr:hypothetical protein BGZ80_000075 [Entomortierella chlamydospora]
MKRIPSSNLAQESTTASSSPGPPKVPPKKPTKRIRISTACINCRQKKIKCDGHVPCAHCEKFRTECVYPTANKPANQEYVETLENRLKSVESHLQGLLSRGWGKGAPGPLPNAENDHEDMIPDEGEASSPYTPSSIPATPPSRSTYNNLNDSQRQSLGLARQLSGATISSPSATGPDPENDDTALNADNSMQVLSLLMGSLKVDRDGAAHYIPKVLDQKERSYNDSRAYGSSPSGSLSDLSLDWELTDYPPSYTLPSTLLTPMAINALMEIYFNSVHTFLPVIHKTSFLTLCQDGKYRVPPFLLMAICAVAARHATDFELQEIPELANLQSHHSLYDHARVLLDTYMDVPRLSTIQGLLLLAYYQIKEKRSGHFFRIRMYINLATRMALDLGLHHAPLKNLSETETYDVGDSLPNMTRPLTGAMHAVPQFSSTLNRQNGPQRDQQVRISQEKQAVIQQENCLAWLGCFFLDGLTSSLMGQDYCVTNASLDMPNLIQDASQMADTVQGATLIFWYHHLELVQIYRRICIFYRAISNEHVLGRAIKGAEMNAVESSLCGWLSKLPAHLVYVSSQSSDAALPSYYTLYLHRFFYSYKLLLYRPLISNKTHRGELRDANSPIAKCSQAATMLTQIGEIIFQNYSWPWPGCGLFAYHMLQAAEIHVFQMVTQSAVDSQSLYYRTMDLIKGYVSLAKLPELEKDVMAMEEMVNNFLLAPQEPIVQSTPHQQQFVATPASDYSYASVMSPASPAESVQRMSVNHNGHGNAHYNHQHHHNGDDTDMFSPLQTHPYPSFESASRMFRPNQSQGPNMAATVTTAAASGFMTNTMSTTDGFTPMGFDLPNVSSSAQASNQSQMYDGHSNSSLPLYGSAANPSDHHQHSAPQMNMFESNNHNHNQSQNQSQNQNQNQNGNGYGFTGYGQSSFLQPTTLTPVGDLLGLGNMDNRDFTTNGSTSTFPSSLAVSNIHLAADPRKKTTAPPPKPPKRMLSQSTGSSSSSSMSQSTKPPVPKKPVRLSESGPRWIAPRPNTGVPVALASTSHTDLPPVIGGNSAGNGNIGPGGPTPAQSPMAGSGNNRTIKVLQPQTTLYGMGNLVNSLGVEQQVHTLQESEAPMSSDRNPFEAHADALNYIQMNPQLYSPMPNQNRQRPVI